MEIVEIAGVGVMEERVDGDLVKMEVILDFIKMDWSMIIVLKPMEGQEEIKNKEEEEEVV